MSENIDLRQQNLPFSSSKWTAGSGQGKPQLWERSIQRSKNPKSPTSARPLQESPPVKDANSPSSIFRVETYLFHLVNVTSETKTNKLILHHSRISFYPGISFSV